MTLPSHQRDQHAPVGSRRKKRRRRGGDTSTFGPVWTPCPPDDIAGEGVAERLSSQDGHRRVAGRARPSARYASRRVRRSAILVLGMHRSRTPAVARVLSLLGAGLPRNLLPPAADNPRGFWESQELMTLHDELVAAAGSSWDDWTRLAPDGLETETVGRFRARLLALLEDNFGAARLFVIKDPRMCRMVPL